MASAARGFLIPGGRAICRGTFDIGSSAATQYINLINSGVSPEAAGKMVGARAVLDAAGETGAFDDAVGAAVKKSGLLDTLIEWGKKVPIVQEVKDRTDVALHRLGMDLDKWNLTRDQETEAIRLVEAVNDFTDGEAGQLAQHVASELTHSDVDATMKSDNTVFLKSRNMYLEGMTHPVTGVPFEKMQFQYGAENYEIVGAEFDNLGSAQLKVDQYLFSRGRQQKLCNENLLEQINNDENLRNAFTEEQIKSLEKRKTPKGYTWHHGVAPGNMQLVDRDIHAKTGHTGGFSIWGAGSKKKEE